MKIHVYAICWNEEKTLPFFIRYYQQYADKIIFYDNDSTDSTPEIIKGSAKCEYHKYDSNGEIRDDFYKDLKNNIWKESRKEADYVIVVDADEYIYSPQGLRKKLEFLKKFKYTLLRPTGYNMISEQFDFNSQNQITNIVKRGMLWKPQSKPCIFDPNKVLEINFTAGAHDCSAEGEVRLYKNRFWEKVVFGELKLLHYKHLTLDYTMARYNIYKQRMSAYNRENKLGIHYLRSDEEFTQEFNSILSLSENII